MDIQNALPVHEKAPRYQHLESQRKRPNAGSQSRRQYFITRILPAALTLLATFTLFRTTFVSRHHYNPDLMPHRPDVLEEAGDGNKVPLEIHVMSKCPDARDCLRQLVVPTMVQVSEKVNLTMSFIGK